jgi:hypothetical protein
VNGSEQNELRDAETQRHKRRNTRGFKRVHESSRERTKKTTYRMVGQLPSFVAPIVSHTDRQHTRSETE